MSHILVFSDSHLGPRFQPGKLELLKEIISSVDRVVINGDFWESYLWTFDRFLDSPWNALFPLLKEREAIYLFGNHDRKELSDRRRERFCAWSGESCELESGGLAFRFEHGNRLAPELDETRPWLGDSPLRRVVPIVESWGLFRPSQCQLERRYQRQNELMKAWAADSLKEDEVLVCGHSHLAELDLEHRFTNSGMVKWGIAQYLVIEDGKVELYNRTY